MVQPGMEGTTGGMTGKRPGSSSSSSSNEEHRHQQKGFGTTPVEGISGGGTQMGQGSMGTGMPTQGYSQGMQGYPSQGMYPNQGIMGQGTMPMNQQG